MTLVWEGANHNPPAPAQTAGQAWGLDPDDSPPQPAPGTIADAHAGLGVAPTGTGAGFQATWNGSNTVGSPDSGVGQTTLPRFNQQGGKWRTTGPEGTTDTRGVNDEYLSVEQRRNIPGVPGGQVTVRGPDAGAGATVATTTTPQGVSTTEASVGLGANVASASVRAGDADNNVRVGVSEGVGFGARVRLGDNHGRARLGFGADIGPVSFDVNMQGGESPQDRALRERMERDNEWAARTVREQDEAAQAAQQERDAAAQRARVARDLGTGGDGTGEGARRDEREAAFRPDPAQVDQEAQLRQQLHAPRHNGLVRVDTRDYHAEMSPSEVEALIGRIHSNSEVAALTHGHR